MVDVSSGAEAILQLDVHSSYFRHWLRLQEAYSTMDEYTRGSQLNSIVHVVVLPSADQCNSDKVTIAHPWLARSASAAPVHNRVATTASYESQCYHGKAPSDALRIIYVKVFKVASTTVATILERMAATHHLSKLLPPGLFNITTEVKHIMLEHNYYSNGGRDMRPCDTVVGSDRAWSWCGGYQPWMDFNMPRAWRLVMVAEPLPRIASMYYYARDFTAGEFTEDGKYERIRNSTYFYHPQGKPSRLDIAAYLSSYRTNWGRVQWHWLREGTPGRTLGDVIQLIDNGAFLVGLTSQFDESLLLWRYYMGLHVRDIIYHSAKTDFWHHKITDWHSDDLSAARFLVSDTGDEAYYSAVSRAFTQQTDVYGGVDKLTQETVKFQSMMQGLNSMCGHVPPTVDSHAISPRTVCMVQVYDEQGMAADWDED